MAVCRNRFWLTLLLASAGASLPALASGAAPAAAPQGTLVPREFHYRIAGAIRPLLFWITDGDVGGARITRRDDESRHSYEFLIGSDPKRTPRGINRWGWVWEEQREDGATQMGLMRKIDERSFQEAEAKAGREGSYVFKAIRTEIAEGRARAENTVWRVRDNYTYYDLDEILRVIKEPPQADPQVNQGPIPAGTHPGLLFALAELVDRAVTAASQNPRELLKDVTTHFNFNAVVCDMTLRESEWEESQAYGDRRYERLVRMKFESYDPQHHASSEFTLVCGTEGQWKGVPVYLKYQPKWWFKLEGVLDESQVFERPREHAAQIEPPAPAAAR